MIEMHRQTRLLCDELAANRLYLLSIGNDLLDQVAPIAANKLVVVLC